MGALSDLPPELQEIEAELQTASQRGDPEACRALRNRLAAEAVFGQSIADEAELARLEIEEDIDTFPEIREAAESRMRDLRLTRIAGNIATARYLYMSARLQQIEAAIR